jgi:Glyoxalase/Bleomycin resistance protein/Dioxygenase superfamily
LLRVAPRATLWLFARGGSLHECVWDYSGAAGQDLSRAEAFYVEKVGLQAVPSNFLNASDGRVGVVVGDDVNQLALYPAEARSSGEFMQAVLQVTDVRAVVEEMRGRGVRFEEYDTAETHTDNGIAQTPDGRQGAWFKDSEGNLIGVVSALGG